MRNKNRELPPVGETVLYMFCAVVFMVCLLGVAFGGVE